MTHDYREIWDEFVNRNGEQGFFAEAIRHALTIAAEYEALRRENEELQAKVNALEMSKIAADTIIDCQKIVMDREQAKLDNVKWQPIETAPKDGTHILAWNYESRFYLPPYICWFGQDMNEPDENKREWLTGDGDGWSTGYYYTPCKPTHWMPLPDAPEQR